MYVYLVKIKLSFKIRKIKIMLKIELHFLLKNITNTRRIDDGLDSDWT